MPYVVSVTSKGQVTVPVEIRKFLGIKPSTKVLFEKQGDQVVVKPVTDFISLRGSVKSKGKVSEEQIDTDVADYIAKKHEA